MSYRICRIFEIENGHMLSKHPDKCKYPHGHTRKVECVLEAPDLDGREMVCDFKVLKLILADYLDQFDHALCMNTDDPAFPEFKERYGDRVIGYESEDPTTEILARDIFQHLRKSLDEYRGESGQEFPLRDSVQVTSVKVWETSHSWAEFTA
ncbi:MAG: 6-carboxytetrahydropterin synthase [Verrucomicrobiales bacterium]|nr:6-carboxytetrahydropterin synthase [Verrucomicrobiales bacterium]